MISSIPKGFRLLEDDEILHENHYSLVEQSEFLPPSRIAPKRVGRTREYLLSSGAIGARVFYVERLASNNPYFNGWYEIPLDLKTKSGDVLVLVKGNHPSFANGMFADPIHGWILPFTCLGRPIFDTVKDETITSGFWAIYRPINFNGYSVSKPAPILHPIHSKALPLP